MPPRSGPGAARTAAAHGEPALLRPHRPVPANAGRLGVPIEGELPEAFQTLTPERDVEAPTGKPRGDSPRSFPPWASIAAISAGVTLAVARYAFLPLRLGVLLQALIVGASCSLVLTGWRGWRVARAAQARLPLPAAALGAVIPAALIAAGFAVATRGEPVESMSLRAVELPGVRAQLPQWATRETSSNSAFGAHVVEEPGTNGFIALRWMASSEATPDQILDQHRAFLPASIEFDSREDAAVGGHPGATASAHTSNGKLHLALTGWSCPTDHRTLTLVTLLERSPSELRALHQRLLLLPWFVREPPAVASRIDGGGDLSVAVA
jgi:hypothetical protein